MVKPLPLNPVKLRDMPSNPNTSIRNERPPIQGLAPGYTRAFFDPFVSDLSSRGEVFRLEGLTIMSGNYVGATHSPSSRWRAPCLDPNCLSSIASI
jgi:hypothetical protein